MVLLSSVMEQQKKYFQTMLSPDSEAFATDKELERNQNRRVARKIPDVDLMRDKSGELYFPSESDRTLEKLQSYRFGNEEV